MVMDSSILEAFFEECEDLLVALTEGLGEMRDGQADNETVNAVFRSVHSIKGAAGAFALDELVGFAHKFETVLDEMRSQRLAATLAASHSQSEASGAPAKGPCHFASAAVASRLHQEVLVLCSSSVASPLLGMPVRLRQEGKHLDTFAHQLFARQLHA
jgi:HPt (histidine-containing phosphotransfer) domain-containing protein